jgi:hypothetical protein
MRKYQASMEDQALWNKAVDYAVNGLLRANGFEIPKDGLYDPRYTGMSCEQIFLELLRKDRT